MVIAKGIANGFPLSGIVSRKKLMDLQKPGSMGGTYAGNPVSCAAGIACAEVMKEEKVLDNVAERGAELLGMLGDLKKDAKAGNTIAEVRGLGLVSYPASIFGSHDGERRVSADFAHPSQMIGIEFGSPSDPYTPSLTGAPIPAKMASRVQAKCLEKNMLTLTTSVYETIRCAASLLGSVRLGLLIAILNSRFIPPLNISQGDMKKGCEIFRHAVLQVVKEG